MDERKVVIKDGAGRVISEDTAIGPTLHDTKGHAQHAMDTSRIFHSIHGETATVYNSDGKPVITYHKR